MSSTGESTWRAWLGVGGCDRPAQVECAEFLTRAKAQAWVERRLVDGAVGAIERGVYLFGPGDGPLVWLPDISPDGMDGAELAELVDGEVEWHLPGRVGQERTGHTG